MLTKGNPGIQLSTSDLNRLFLFATAETHFIFKGTYHDQVDGVATGSPPPPLAPVLANLFMGHPRRSGSNSRYKDDTFCLFNSERDADLFFYFVNNQPINNHFTMERESNQVLPFLDVLLNNKPHNSLSPPYTAKRPSRNCLPIF